MEAPRDRLPPHPSVDDSNGQQEEESDGLKVKSRECDRRNGDRPPLRRRVCAELYSIPRKASSSTIGAPTITMMANTSKAQKGPASRNSTAISPAAEEKSPAMAWVMTATMPAKINPTTPAMTPPADIAPRQSNAEINARSIAPKSSDDQRPAGKADPGHHRPHQGGNGQRCIQKQQRNPQPPTREQSQRR